VYDNGLPSLSFTLSTNFLSVNLTSNYIGKSNWPNASLLQGKVDEFRLYGRVLAASEVMTVFNNHGEEHKKM
jgi:hypothetical protein